MSASFDLPGSATAPAPESKKDTITLSSSDGRLFTVDKEVAMEFATVKRFFDDMPEFTDTAEMVVPLPIAHSKLLSLAITYCKDMLRLKEDVEAKEKYEKTFVEERSNWELKGLIMVANYLEVKYMLVALNQGAADRIKDKSVEYVRKFFGVDNDFTPEEEAKLREENSWAFEGVNEEKYVD